jgi:SAM-dependent methyltransferase
MRSWFLNWCMRALREVDRQGHDTVAPMKIDVRAESVLERIALAMGQVPVPIAHALGGALLARSVIAATRLGIFEALRAGELGADAVAPMCGTDVTATQKLLDVLVSAGYLVATGPRYGLAPMSRQWMLRDSPNSLYDAILYQRLESTWLDQLEVFVQTGRPLDFHTTMTRDEWGLYQRAMRAIAGLVATEVARRLRLPSDSQRMLDIGGGHGFYAVTLCRQYPSLRAIVLDLPEAVEHAAPLLARERMEGRVVHRKGNALVDDLGSSSYDLVLLAQLVHHFDESTNRELVCRAARALRPGGQLVIVEPVSRDGARAGQVARLLDLYFAFTSRGGTWSFDDLARWQRRAGLQPRPPMRFRRLPDFGAQVATKSRPSA